MQKRIAWTLCDNGTMYSNFKDQIYLFVPLRAPPHDVVMCTHTPGGLLTAQRPLSASVSSSRTPPLLPEKRKRGKVSHVSSSYDIITLRCACRQ